ncbi:MAG: HlyD family efflux transporter periplasmic adaptor subunit, partial [Rubripirellula sp.]
PEAGRLIAAPRRKQDAQNRFLLVGWSGYPTESRNQHCYLQPGQELMSLSTSDQWDAELILSQHQVERIAVGAKVQLALESSPADKFSGQVISISRSAWASEINRDRRDDREASQYRRPAETSYAVRVSIDSAPTHVIAGATAISRIDSQPISVVGRTTRFLSGLFRFR